MKAFGEWIKSRLCILKLFGRIIKLLDLGFTFDHDALSTVYLLSMHIHGLVFFVDKLKISCVIYKYINIRSIEIIIFKNIFFAKLIL